MTNGPTMRSILLFLGVVITLVSTAQMVTARDDDKCENEEQKKQRVGTIRRVRYEDKGPFLEVEFTHVITSRDLANAPKETWVVVDITQSATDRAIYVIRDPERNDHTRRTREAPGDITGVYLYLSQRLKPGHSYRLFQSRLTFKACKPDDPLEGSVKVEEKVAPTPGQTPAPVAKPAKPNFFPKSKSEGREDSNFYLSGAVEGAKGSDTQFSADIKVELPVGTRSFFKEIGPYFNLKTSTADDADANSLSFGVKLRHPHNIPRKSRDGEFIGPDRRILTGLVFDLLPGFESDRRFKNVNTVLGTRLYLIPRVAGKASIGYFQPYIGYEIGRNLKSPVAEAEHRGLSRGLIGGALYVDLFPKDIKGASLQVDYVRRFLFRREIGFKENDDKTLVPVDIGKGPRDDVKTTFGLDFSDFTGLTFSYEYGRMPPIFNLIDHKFSFGLVYKFQTKYPGK